jgi:hypothetical protein
MEPEPKEIFTAPQHCSYGAGVASPHDIDRITVHRLGANYFREKIKNPDPVMCEN